MEWLLPGASVTARQTDTNVTVEAASDGDGRFRFPYLRIGPYELRTRLQGFKEQARTVVLSAGSAFDLSITLEIGGIDAAITVVGDNVNANDQVYNQVFPYSATPHAGPTNRKDP